MKYGARNQLVGKVESIKKGAVMRGQSQNRRR
jgi:molybdopterin-binding protein